MDAESVRTRDNYLLTKEAVGHDIGAIFFWVFFFRSYKEKYLVEKRRNQFLNRNRLPRLQAGSFSLLVQRKRTKRKYTP